MDPTEDTSMQPELLSTLDYAMLPPEDRDNYAWDENLELYYLVYHDRKFQWDAGDLVPEE